MPGRGKGLKQIFLGFSSVLCVCAMDTNWTLNIPRTLEKTSCAKVIITSDIAGNKFILLHINKITGISHLA